MTSYILSAAADADVERILVGSISHWGVARAERYIRELHEAFEALGLIPHIGRDAGHIREGYFQFYHGSHSVFYQTTDAGIFIVRILHQKQMPENYL
jgi:toxin ParE1/3/4